MGFALVQFTASGDALPSALMMLAHFISTAGQGFSWM